MSAEKCPFEIEPRKETASETYRKDRYVSFDVPIDPGDEDGLKASHEFRRLDSPDPEDVLVFIETLNSAIETLDVAEGVPRFRLVKSLLAGDPAKQWVIITNTIDVQDQENFVYCVEQLALAYMDREISIDTKEWLQQIKKPKSMSVQAFLAQLRHFNDLIDYMPLPFDGAEEEDRVPRFSDAELSIILRKACPKSWREAQVKANLKNLNLNEQANYYSSLKKMEDPRDTNRNGRDNNNKNVRGRNVRNNSNGKNNNNNKSNNRSNGKKYCSIHGNCNHSTKECDIIQREKSSYENKNQNNNNNNNNNRRNNNNRGYNVNNRNRSEENNQISDNNRRSQQRRSTHGSNNNNRNRTSSTTSSNESDNEEDFNMIEEVYFTEVETENALVSDTSTETRVQVTSSNNSPSLLLGLLDTGASGTYISANVLSKVKHTIEPISVPIRGRYSKVTASRLAKFDVKLPDFCNTKTISIRAYVDENPVGRHDIIFGTRVCQQLGLVFDFKHKLVTWDDISIPMKQRGSIDRESLNTIDNEDKDLPPFMQIATQRLTKGLSANTYDKHNYKEMVLRCHHLTTEQQHTLLDLFQPYAELFSGKIGMIPGPPVHLKLKPNAKPYYAKAYNIPHSIYSIARKEISDLEKAGVIQSNVQSPWGAPCMFRGKKDGGVRFLTDLRKLNASIERNPFPLPLIDECLWKIQGFTFATCFDLNRGYYHFLLDEYSQRLCGIVLPWGHAVYKRLPQGLMVSSDIFQRRMVQLFGHMEDVLVYIDNIILFTKKSFEHHLSRITMILSILKQNNLHVHVEQSFLASQSVDYLGYTLTTKGIMPQNKKILTILALAPPANHKQLRSFLGFINYYKKLWYHRSSILAPLTAISSSKVKFVWGPEQQKAFIQIRNTIARQVLLRYPDFTQPFDIYTDASNDQIGGVISQAGHPIAFYSRKLSKSQQNYTTMEKELLSIVETAEQHRNILLGFECRFYSDHKNLSFENFASERVRRWRLLLEEYNYTFSYFPGKDNVIADMISRYPMLPVSTQTVEELNTMDDDDMFPINFETIAKEQAMDMELNQQLQTKPFYKKKMFGNYELILRKDKIVLSNSTFDKVLQWYHTNLNHPGEQRTYLTLFGQYYVSNMEAKVRAYVKNCPICRQRKRPSKKYGLVPLPDKQYNAWQATQVDLFGPWSFVDINNNEHKFQAISIIDVATRWPELVPYDSKRSEDISMIFDRVWLCRYPRPEFVIYDNGSEFSAEFVELLQSYGIKNKPTTIKNPQANAFIERTHQVIANALRTMELEKRSIDDSSFAAICANVVFGMRATYHTELQATPAQIVFGRDMVINASYLADWKAIASRREQSVQRNNARENSQRVPHQYKCGDKVYIRVSNISRKLAVQEGPFEILKVNSNGTVSIRRSPIVRETIHIRRLHPA